MTQWKMSPTLHPGAELVTEEKSVTVVPISNSLHAFLDSRLLSRCSLHYPIHPHYTQFPHLLCPLFFPLLALKLWLPYCDKIFRKK